jgi:hypothetical protein
MRMTAKLSLVEATEVSMAFFRFVWDGCNLPLREIRQTISKSLQNQSINQSDDGAKILHEIADPIHHLHIVLVCVRFDETEANLGRPEDD